MHTAFLAVENWESYQAYGSLYNWKRVEWPCYNLNTWVGVFYIFLKVRFYQSDLYIFLVWGERLCIDVTSGDCKLLDMYIVFVYGLMLGLFEWHSWFECVHILPYVISFRKSKKTSVFIFSFVFRFCGYIFCNPHETIFVHLE